MKKKNILVIILTVLVFLSGAILGVANVYRVNEVCVYAPVVSEEAKSESALLQEKLTQAYTGESTFSVTQERADELIAEFPYFRITDFKRAYPNRIVVEITEDAEVFAVPVNGESGKYYILNAEGTVLGIRKDYKNRADGNDNLLVGGLQATGVVGKGLEGDTALQSFFALTSKISSLLDGIRRNVLSVEVVRPASDYTQTVFKFAMREGVKLYISNPAQNTEQKAEVAVNEYLGITSAQRLTGMVVVSDGVEGVIGEYFLEEW